MTSLTADNTPLSKLAQAKESVEIRDENGLLLGTYQPANEVRRSVPGEMIKKLEARAKMQSNGKEHTLDVMFEHPMHTVGPLFSTECNKLAFAIQISRLFHHFGIKDTPVSETELLERLQQGKLQTPSMSQEIVEARDE